MDNISARTVRRLGHGILISPGMKRERGFIQHGDVSVLEHSFMVAVLCVAIARRLPGKWDYSSLVRGALLHDYFLYDWHIKDPNRPAHATHHAAAALRNARRDFHLNPTEENMIASHMFPLGGAWPGNKQSAVLWVADKVCAARETVVGRLPRKWQGGIHPKI